MPSYPITLPADPRPREVTWKQVSRVAVSSSPLTGQSQVYVHQGQWWEINFELPPLHGATAASWAGKMLGLNGREGFFKFAPTDSGSSNTGAAVVKNRLSIDFITIKNIGGFVSPGTWLQIENGLYRVTVGGIPVGGEVAVAIWPYPRAEIQYDVSSVNYTDPVGRFRLFDSFEWDMNVARLYGINIGTREVV